MLATLEPTPPEARPASPPAPQSTHRPPPPAPTPPEIPNQSLLLRLFLDGSLSVLDICEHAELTLHQLEAWAASDWARSRFAAVERVSTLRDQLITAEAVPQARHTLTHLATNTHDTTPAALHESRRKAAMALCRNHPVPLGEAQCPVPSRPRATDLFSEKSVPPHPRTKPIPIPSGRLAPTPRSQPPRQRRATARPPTAPPKSRHPPARRRGEP